MKHFSPEQWADYVRSAIPEAQKKTMQRHLQSGCRNCNRIARMWAEVHKLMLEEGKYSPPDSVVRFVKGHYALGRPRRKLSRATQVAQLIFDSFRQPLPAGIRSSQGTARHLVLRAGSMLVDMRLEPAHQSFPASLAGQVLDHSNPEHMIGNVPVTVRSPRKIITSTATNQFGEFQVELSMERSSNLRLDIGVDVRSPIVIPLRVIDAPGERAMRSR
jgi:hypothetical protein